MTESTIKNGKQRSSPDKVTRRAKKITPQYLHNAGLYYLQRFAASKKQFASVMDRKIRKSCKDHPEQDYENCKRMLDTLVDTFERCGLLNDDLYLESMIDSLRRRGLSRSTILQKLAHKGIDRPMTIKKMQQKDDNQDTENAAATKFAQKKKLGPFSKVKSDDPKDRNKAFAAFARAGFSYDTARKILNAEIDENY